jgi:hypothetical protein
MGWNPSLHWHTLTLTPFDAPSTGLSVHTVLARYAQSLSDAQAPPGNADMSEQLYL